MTRPAQMTRAQKITSLCLFFLALLYIVSQILPDTRETEYNEEIFGNLPALTGGRVKPLDSVARNHLRILSGRSTVEVSGEKRPAIAWLMRLGLTPDKVADWPVFRIDHPQVKDLIGETDHDKKYFSFRDLSAHLDAIGQQAGIASDKEEQQRSPYERALVQLSNNVGLYNQLAISFIPPPFMGPAMQEYQTVIKIAEKAGTADMKQPLDFTEEDDMALQSRELFGRRYQELAANAALRLVPPQEPDAPTEKWQTVYDSLDETLQTGRFEPVVELYARLSEKLRNESPDGFGEDLQILVGVVSERYPAHEGEILFERFFNHFAPFYTAMVVYIMAFLCVAVAWLVWPRAFGQASFRIFALAFAVHTFGLIARMVIQDRPPVTNLYSSAVFIGWFSVLLCFFLEYFSRTTMATAAGSIVGFCTLIIAHNLAKEGDTMEMMRAVLDSNFWLATHVVTVTIGYSATFLAGILAILFIVVGLFTSRLDKSLRKNLERMVYGIICFALLFSFIGTVLGGIWADQSWGRFWGWDPKENGALMIVLWNALILHARWGGLIKQRGLMALAIAGNIITAWSWFGTNLLGVGLHSYGFTSSGFMWLSIFAVTQIVLIGLAAIPERHWSSFRKTTPAV